MGEGEQAEAPPESDADLTARYRLVRKLFESAKARVDRAVAKCHGDVPSRPVPGWVDRLARTGGGYNFLLGQLRSELEARGLPVPPP